jgi:hypothetical protein
LIVSIQPMAATYSDEHSLIANYSTRLSDYYSRNPHLSLSSSNGSPSLVPSSTPLHNNYHHNHHHHHHHQNNYQYQRHFKPNLKPSTNNTTIYDEDDYDEDAITNMHGLQSRTTSLSRNSSRFVPPSVNKNGPNVNFQLSSSSRVHRSHSKAKNDKEMYGTLRSLSESNFHVKDELPLINTDESSNNMNERLLNEKRDIVLKLEQQNQQILNEIKRLRVQQLSNQSLDITDSPPNQTTTLFRRANSVVRRIKNENSQGTSINNLSSSSFISNLNPKLAVELQTLRAKKGLLDNRMNTLESSRGELLNRLNQLDNLLKEKENTSSSTPTKVITTTTNSKINDLPIVLSTTTTTISPGSSNTRTNIDSDNIITKTTTFTASPAFDTSTVQEFKNSPSKSRNSATSSFLPIMSAEMTSLQMPLSNRNKPTDITTTTTTTTPAKDVNNNLISNKSWSVPSTPSIYEFHYPSNNQRQVR